MAQKLSDEMIEAQLNLLNGWRREGTIIIKRYTMPSFPAALVFVGAIGHIAEGLDHHPDILIQWKNVTISISTHSAGGLTDKDFQLARHIDALPSRA
jgi:4a-hydroxytetrahydrobiopterin dehydratase